MNWKKRKKLRETVNHYNNRYGRVNGRNIQPCEYKYIIQGNCFLRAVIEFGIPFGRLDKYGCRGYKVWEDRMYGEDV